MASFQLDKKQNSSAVGGGALKGALTGAATGAGIGMAAGPYGALVGGAIGAVVGGVGGGAVEGTTDAKAQKDAYNADQAEQRDANEANLDAAAEARSGLPKRPKAVSAYGYGNSSLTPPSGLTGYDAWKAGY